MLLRAEGATFSDVHFWEDKQAGQYVALRVEPEQRESFSLQPKQHAPFVVCR